MNDSDENDELGAAYKDLMLLVLCGAIPFEDVIDIMTYIDKKLEKMSRELIWQKVSEIEHFFNLLAQKPEFHRKLQKLQDLAICLNIFFPSPEKPTTVQSFSCIDSLHDKWFQFADEHKIMDIYLNLHS